MIVRPARPADIPSMHAVRLAVRENRLSDPRSISEESYRPYVDGLAWVAEIEGRLAGFAAVDGNTSRVWALFVEPSAANSGVGSALHECMLKESAARGLSRLWLGTAPGTRAERFYERKGWRRTGVTDDGEILFERDL